jgi:hypothetical protein
MLQAYVSSVFDISYIGMLPDVGKVDRDVSYIAIVIHVCCKRLFLMFCLFLDVRCKRVYLDVAYVSHICCKVFYLDVVYVCNCGFASVSDACFKCSICLHIYVASVVFGYFKSRLGLAHVAM